MRFSPTSNPESKARGDAASTFHIPSFAFPALGAGMSGKTAQLDPMNLLIGSGVSIFEV